MKEEERDDHMIMAKIAYCRPVIELVMEELDETSSLSSSSAQGVDSLLFDMNFKGVGYFKILQGCRVF